MGGREGVGVQSRKEGKWHGSKQVKPLHDAMKGGMAGRRVEKAARQPCQSGTIQRYHPEVLLQRLDHTEREKGMRCLG